VLHDHVEKVEPSAIGGGVELEVHLLRRSPRATLRPGAGAQPGDLAPSRQPGLPSSACGGWAAAGPPRTRAGAPGCGSASSLPAAIGGGACAGPSGYAQLRSRGDDASAWLLKINELAEMALAAVVLAHNAADAPLGCPVTVLQDFDGLPAMLRAQNILREIPRLRRACGWSIALSSSAYARSLLSSALSFSSRMSRVASSAFIPPKSCRQRWLVGRKTSRTRQASTTVWA